MMFTELGVASLIIREPEMRREFFDTGWTIKLLQGLLIAAMLVLITPVAVYYFKEPRLVSIIYVLAVAAVIEGAENIGLTLIRKRLDFAKDFQFVMYKRLFIFGSTLVLAFALRNYWALVIGTVMGSIFGVFLSYRLDPYRPRLRLQYAEKFLVFGWRIVLYNIARYWNDRVDSFVVGGLASTSEMGVYNVASELSRTVVSELVMPIGRALLPSYAKVKDVKVLEEVYLRTLGGMAILIFPLGFGLATIAEEFVLLVLGDKWMEVIPLLEWLAFYGLATALLHALMGQIFIVMGHERIAMHLQWARVLILVPAVVSAGNLWGIKAIPISATCVTLVFVLFVSRAITRISSIKPIEMLDTLWRPIIASAGMMGFIMLIEPTEAGLGFRLMIMVAAGALFYVVVLIVLWMLAGCPPSMEYAAIRGFAHKIKIKLGRGME
jgi:O-antigen/teichoic acid export membrane protein